MTFAATGTARSPIAASWHGLVQIRTRLAGADLRARIADATTTLRSLKGQAERAELRESMRRYQAHLAHWEQMRPLQEAGMCSEMRQADLAFARVDNQP